MAVFFRENRLIQIAEHREAGARKFRLEICKLVCRIILDLIDEDVSHSDVALLAGDAVVQIQEAGHVRHRQTALFDLINRVFDSFLPFVIRNVEL